MESVGKSLTLQKEESKLRKVVLKETTNEKSLQNMKGAYRNIEHRIAYMQE